MLLSACETRKEQMFFADDADAVQISATVACQHTKSNPIGEGEELRKFNANDIIGVETPDLLAEYVLSGTKWQPKDMYYFRWHTAPVTFRAYYPVGNGCAYDKFTVRPNQYSAANLAASDYMTGEAVDMYRQEVNILMHRRMAKVTVTLKGVEAGTKIQAMKIGSYHSYTDGEPEGSASISPYVLTTDIEVGTDGTKYTAIVLPGPENTAKDFIAFNYKGQAVKIKGIPYLEQGYSYEYELTFNGTAVTVSDPVVKSWTEGINVTTDSGEIPEQQKPEPEPDQPGDDPQDPTTSNDVFVTPEGAGDKSGSSWENALGMAEFRPMFGSDYGAKTAEDCAALDGKTFHFMEGSYCATSAEKDRLKIDFNSYGKPCTIVFLGGYDSSSTGVDLSKRDPSANVTKFTGDRNGNGKADDGDTGILCLDAFVNLTMDGFTFAHSKGSARWKQKAFILNTDKDGAWVNLSLNDCKFEDLYDYNDSDAKYEGGAALWICCRSTAMINNCEFTDCHSTSRGGAVRLNDGNSVAFINGCTFHGNSISDSWGNAIQISNGNFFMNNSTISNCTGKGGALNGGGNWLVVNSTIVNSFDAGSVGSNMTLRNESKTANNITGIVNSVVIYNGEGNSVVVTNSDRNLASYGHNLIGAYNEHFTPASADKTGLTLTSLGMTWNAAGYYLWNGEVADFAKVTLTDLETKVKEGCNKSVGSYTNLGLDFYNWLQTIGNGKNPLAYDQAGNQRNSSGLTPGAYEKH